MQIWRFLGARVLLENEDEGHILCSGAEEDCIWPLEREREIFWFSVRVSLAMEWLSKWLLFVGFCRLSAVYFGFFDVWALRLAIFSKLEVVQDVHGRTFAVWTLLTCTLCLLLAFNLDDRILYQITFLSFVYALGYFLIECFIYGTMAVKNLASMFFFAGVSIIWMSWEWNKHIPRKLEKQI